jgi:hypothetical protein
MESVPQTLKQFQGWAHLISRDLNQFDGTKLETSTYDYSGLYCVLQLHNHNNNRTYAVSICFGTIFDSLVPK